ncbi:hypothetical protein EV182_004707, partial [Spiromyces aspiralis]
MPPLAPTKATPALATNTQNPGVSINSGNGGGNSSSKRGRVSSASRFEGLTQSSRQARSAERSTTIASQSAQRPPHTEYSQSPTVVWRLTRSEHLTGKAETITPPFARGIRASKVSPTIGNNNTTTNNSPSGYAPVPHGAASSATHAQCLRVMNDANRELQQLRAEIQGLRTENTKLSEDALELRNQFYTKVGEAETIRRQLTKASTETDNIRLQERLSEQINAASRETEMLKKAMGTEIEGLRTQLKFMENDIRKTALLGSRPNRRLTPNQDDLVAPQPQQAAMATSQDMTAPEDHNGSGHGRLRQARSSGPRFPSMSEFGHVPKSKTVSVGVMTDVVASQRVRHISHSQPVVAGQARRLMDKDDGSNDSKVVLEGYQADSVWRLHECTSKLILDYIQNRDFGSLYVLLRILYQTLIRLPELSITWLYGKDRNKSNKELESTRQDDSHHKNLVELWSLTHGGIFEVSAAALVDNNDGHKPAHSGGD